MVCLSLNTETAGRPSQSFSWAILQCFIWRSSSTGLCRSGYQRFHTAKCKPWPSSQGPKRSWSNIEGRKLVDGELRNFELIGVQCHCHATHACTHVHALPAGQTAADRCSSCNTYIVSNGFNSWSIDMCNCVWGSYADAWWALQSIRWGYWSSVAILYHMLFLCLTSYSIAWCRQLRIMTLSRKLGPWNQKTTCFVCSLKLNPIQSELLSLVICHLVAL